MEQILEAHIEESNLVLYKGLDKSVRLYKFIGDIHSEKFERVKEYFIHVTPEYALNNRLIGFSHYRQIGYYCQEHDVWIVEEMLEVPLELTVNYTKQILIDEKDKIERECLDYVRKTKNDIAKINEGFEDAKYPDRRHDHILDLINNSRIYIPEGRKFFSQYGVMYLIREQGDFMARLSNSEYDNGMCNSVGIVRGIFCYTRYKSRIARLINEICLDKTEEFRRLYSRKLSFKGYPKHTPPHRVDEYPICCKCHRRHRPHVDCKYAKRGLY